MDVALSLTKFQEYSDILWVRATQPTKLLAEKDEIHLGERFVSSFKEKWNLAISICEDWVVINRIKALLPFQHQNDNLDSTRKRKGPLTYD